MSGSSPCWTRFVSKQTWPAAPLDALASPVSGGTPSLARPEYWNGDIPWVSAKDMSAFRLADTEMHVSEEGARSGTRVVPAGTPLILVRGMTLLQRVPVVMPTRAIAFNQDVKALVPRDGVTAPYLAYALLAARQALAALVDTASHGTGRIATDLLMQLRVPVPPRSDQDSIVRALSAFDERIELNVATSATLQSIAMALLARSLADAARLGSRSTLGDHIEVTRGLSYTGAGLGRSGVPLHNLNSIREGGGYKRDGIKYYSGEYKERHLVRPGDIVVANTDLAHKNRVIGYPAIVPARYGEVGLFSQDLFRVRIKDGSPLTPAFVYLLLRSEPLRSIVAGYRNGTTVSHLPGEALARPTFPLPAPERISALDARVSPLLAKIEANEDKNETLAALRDALLPRLISGELRVKPDDLPAASAVVA